MANGIIPYAPTTHLNEITCKVYFQALSKATVYYIFSERFFRSHVDNKVKGVKTA